MIKKLAILLAICSFAFQSHTTAVVIKKSGVTDYTQDAACEGAWFMNGSASGSETDRSGNGITLSNNASVGSSTDVPSGYSGKSRDFEEDENDYLSVTDASSGGLDFTGTAFTIVFWHKSEGYANNEFASVVSKSDNSTTESYQALVFYQSGGDGERAKFQFSDDGTANSHSATSDTFQTQQQWIHWAFRCNGTTCTVFANGVEDDTGTSFSQNIYNSSDDFIIGRDDGSGSNETDGLVDEVAFFSRALTDAEIADIKNNGLDGTKGGND